MHLPNYGCLLTELWLNSVTMKKSEAIQMLGGSVPSAARALQVTVQAIAKWPDVLPLRIADRVRGAHVRIYRSANDPQASQRAEQGVANA